MTLFGLNLVLGYLAMLVAMTYSIELFICVVVGLMFGHFYFNTKTPVGESVDPCCASQQQAGSELAVNNAANGHVASSRTLSRTPCDLEAEMDSDHEELCCHQQQQDEEAGTRNSTLDVSSSTRVIQGMKCLN